MKSMTDTMRMDFGEFLLNKKIVKPDQLYQALKGTPKAQRTSDLTRDMLLKQGLISEEDAARTLADFYGLPYVDLRHTTIDPLAVQKISVRYAQQHILIAFFLAEKEISVALKTYDFAVLDQLKKVTGCEVLVHMASKNRIEEAIEVQYAAYMTQEALAKFDLNRLVEAKDGSKIVQDFSDGLIVDAIKERASDVHIEPQDGFVRIRYRIDGVLEEKLKLPAGLLRQLVSRYKIMAGMDIAETRRPQDGRIRFMIGSREFDLRVSVIPGSYGEKIVMRILDKLGVSLNLDNMYFSEQIHRRLMRVIRSSNGLFFVTGPTGSGKTTTCYAAVNYLNNLECNIVTIEDPIEYRLPILNQIQINHDIGLDFPSALRSVLRQDPDIILVGEIRDAETARIATQAALTGHFVLSTLHTNNAVEAVVRLVDIGVEPFLVAPTILGVLSQRLVRRVCRHCQETYAPTAEEYALFRLKPGEREIVLYRGGGCPACRHTGYLGRMGIHELVVVTDVMREQIMKGATMGELAAEARRSGYRPMRNDGLKKALLGLTTLSEVFRSTTIQEDLLT